MSHLAHEACGCDFFISFCSFEPKVLQIVQSLKDYLKKQRATFCCSNSFNYEYNYMETCLLQAIRSKIFLFFIDKYSIENDLFLYTLHYAQIYSKTNYLPILISVLCDQSLNEHSSNLTAMLTDGSVLNFQIFKQESIEVFLTSLSDSVHDLVPIGNQSEKLTVRCDDRFRPKNLREEAFMRSMKSLEFDLMKNMQISTENLKSCFPSERVISCLSIPCNQLKSHIDRMLTADFHLIWADCVFVNKTNYFSLLWTANDQSKSRIRCARPPTYLVFYDLNPAQLESIYNQYTKDNWSMDIIESYTKNKDSKVLLKKRRQQVNSSNSNKSYEEIRYFCQLKFCPRETPNELKHSIIDSRFKKIYDKNCGLIKGKLYIPIRHTRVSMNVNVINNVHFYHSVLFKLINLDEKSCYEKKKFYDENDIIMVDNVYKVRDNLTDNDLKEAYDELNQSGWKMIDLKAYKDKNSDIKFSTIWTSLECFREGTSLLFVGITQDEFDQLRDKLKKKFLYPKLVVNYGYLDIKHEHVYVIYFTQE